MRTSDGIVRMVLMGLALGLVPAQALDGRPSDGPGPMVPIPAPAVNAERLPAATAPSGLVAPVAVPTSPAAGVPPPPCAVPGAGPAARTAAPTPVEAFRDGAQALRAGEKERAVTSLQYAAEQGHALAQWKLGRMYAEGDGVERSDLRAFQYFSRIADAYADD